MTFLETVVDRLPERLWSPGNLYIVPGGDWHFCVGAHPRLDYSVRTIEWRGREVAHGNPEFTGWDDRGDEVDIGEFVGLGRWGYYPGQRRKDAP